MYGCAVQRGVLLWLVARPRLLLVLRAVLPLQLDKGLFPEKAVSARLDVREVVAEGVHEQVLLLADKFRFDFLAGKPFDKAGSYGVQDGFGLVSSVKGSVYNVIGFPIEKIKFTLDAL